MLLLLVEGALDLDDLISVKHWWLIFNLKLDFCHRRISIKITCILILSVSSLCFFKTVFVRRRKEKFDVFVILSGIRVSNSKMFKYISKAQ